MSQELRYAIWIEAEEWAGESWTPHDANTDVIVTREDRSRWVATFISYENVRTLTSKYRVTGECLSGAYFWASNMILIDEVNRLRIEEVIRDLIQEGSFESVFSRLPDLDPQKPV